MGAGASAQQSDVIKAELAKPADASDVTSLEEAKAEVARLRNLLNENMPGNDSATKENSPSVVQAEIDAAAADYAKMNALFASMEAKPGVTEFKIGFIADQDQASRTEEGWETAFAIGTLKYTPGEGGAVGRSVAVLCLKTWERRERARLVSNEQRTLLAPISLPPPCASSFPSRVLTPLHARFCLRSSYAIEMEPYEKPAVGHKLLTTRGDKKGRGAEFSAIQVYQNKLLIFDDRTGNVDEIAKEGEGYALKPYLDGELEGKREGGGIGWRGRDASRSLLKAVSWRVG